MSKIYTGGDNTFTGKNTFENGFSLQDNKIANLQTPSNSTDGTNKLYVDSVFITLKDYNVVALDSSSSTTTDMTSTSVTVASGQKVLLLAHGYFPGSGSFDLPDGEIWFRRGSTDLTYTDASKMRISDNDLSSQPFGMMYLDTSPGTGTVTYRIRGFVEFLVQGRFTVIVFN